MTKSNLLPGLLGKVLKRGTRVLRIAHAKVTSGVHVHDFSAVTFNVLIQ